MHDFSVSTAIPEEAKLFIQALYGGMPPPPQGVTTTLVHTLTTASHQLQIWQVLVSEPQGMHWHLTLHTPLAASSLPVSVLLSPDGCWPHVLNTQAIDAVLAQGVALANFDRLNMAQDHPEGLRRGRLHDQWPQAQWGAISAWAWGLQANVQALLQIQGLSRTQIGVIGHSRGGKAALLAGALEPQIALTVSHNSGCAGAASFQVRDAAAETLDGLQARFGHWLGLGCSQAEVRAQLESTDNQALLKCLTGRHLCVLQADDDVWANPQGTAFAVARLRAHWQPLGLEPYLHCFTRPGDHSMTALDWTRAAQTLAQTEAQNLTKV
jgi:dienelactone hydrolase